MSEHWYKEKMSGPWYEETSPSPAMVRKDITESINRERSLNANQSSLLADIVLQHVPDTRNDFGSFRGYATFGVGKSIAREVMVEYDATQNLIRLLKPAVAHWLHKPEGPRYQKAKTSFAGSSAADSSVSQAQLLGSANQNS